MQKGDSYYSDDGLLIAVNRVSKTQAWADIEVFSRNGASWTKRQPLFNGEFAFKARKVAP
jgi:hypothetical protein